MALTDHKIIASDITTNGVISAPDRLTGTAAENKAVFDKLISADTASVKKRHNDLIDALVASSGTTGAAQIGATDADDTASNVQAVLDDLADDKADKVTDATDGNVAQFDEDGNIEDSGHALSEYVVKVTGKGLSTNDYDDTEKSNVASNTSARHTHSNKSLLDTYTQTESNLDDAVTKKHSHAHYAVLETISEAPAPQSTTYTKTEVDSAISSHHDSTKADASTTYTKTEVDTALSGKVNTTESSLSTTSKNVVGAINEVNTLAASKSIVTVANSGTATDTVGYITINGVEKKLAGGGSGGTSDYTELVNKPQINLVTLNGNLSSSDLGLVSAETGKGLSTNDYDDTEKGNVASNTSARHTHSNKALLDTYTQTEANLASAVSHVSNTSNPHSVTASQVGLGNCNNTSDANKPISTATQTALNAKAARDTDAVSGNVAKFDASGNPIDSGYAANNILGLSYSIVSTWT